MSTSSSPAAEAHTSQGSPKFGTQVSPNAQSLRGVDAHIEELKGPEWESSPLEFEIDTKKRVVFVSGPFMSQQLNQIPEKVVRRSLCVFPCRRSWIFPELPEEAEQASPQAASYLSLSEEFKKLLLDKEEKGQVFFLSGPERFPDLSRFLQGVSDPCTGGCYDPLQLDEQWWMENFIGGDYTSGPNSVVATLQNPVEDMDVSAFMELLYQSNNTLLPVLLWDESLLSVL